MAKSQAAVVIQNLLEKHQELTGLSASPAALANKLVEVTWRSSSELFDGKISGKRAHKVTIAAHSLAAAAYGASKKGNEQLEVVFSLCLGEILRAIESSPQSFELSEVDFQLLARVREVFVELANDPKHSAVDQLLASGT